MDLNIALLHVMVLSGYDLDQLIAVGGSGDLLAKKENRCLSQIVKYYSYRRFRCCVEDGSALFVFKLCQVSSAGVEKVTGRTCRGISSATCR